MSAVRDPYSGRTMKQADLRWNEIEHDLAILDKRKKKFFAWVEHFRLSYNDVDRTQLDDWNEQIRHLSQEQARLEMFLIENECPGWTST